MASTRTIMFMLLLFALMMLSLGSPVENLERRHSKDGKFNHRNGHHKLHKNLAENGEENAAFEVTEDNGSKKGTKHHLKHHQNHHAHRNLDKAIQEESIQEFLKKNGISSKEFLKFVATIDSKHKMSSNFVMPRKLGICGPRMRMDPLGNCRPIWST